ncbi:MAG: hypothetical protein WCK58_07495, partial [Chloroflexota bacterium]
MAAGTTVLLAGIAVLLAGCGTLPWPGQTSTALAAGVIGGSAWSAAAYASSQEGTCVEVRFANADPQRVCAGAGAGREVGTMRLDAPDGSGSVVLAQIAIGPVVSGT